jgi:hypothetical protein
VGQSLPIVFAAYGATGMNAAGGVKGQSPTNPFGATPMTV